MQSDKFDWLSGFTLLTDDEFQKEIANLPDKKQDKKQVKTLVRKTNNLTCNQIEFFRKQREEEQKKNKLKNIVENKNKPYGQVFKKDQLTWHLHNMYDNFPESKFIVIAYGSADGKIFHQWAIRIKDLYTTTILDRVIKLSQTYNVWFSQACFYKPYRRLECIYATSTIAIDLDYYKCPKMAHMDVLDVIGAINKQVPLKPSYYVHSGRGLTAIYLTNNIALNSPKLVDVRNKLVDQLVCLLSNFGADQQAKDLTRVNKPPQVTNQKNKAKTYIVDFKNVQAGIVTYNFTDLCNAFFPHTLQEVQDFKSNKTIKKTSMPVKRPNLGIRRNFRYDRCSDLYTLVKMRSGNVKGYRNTLCHLYATYWRKYNSLKNVDDCIKATQSFNATFVEPLNDDDIIRTVKKAYDVDYKYKTTTIINLLDIKEFEMDKLKTLVSKEISNKRRNEKEKLRAKEKVREEHKGLTTREYNKLQNTLKVAELLDLGMKQKDISIQLGLSKSYVSEIVSDLKSKTLKDVM